MRKATEERIATARANTEARAHEDAQAAAVRMGRMAELDERKLLLQGQARHDGAGVLPGPG